MDLLAAIVAQCRTSPISGFVGADPVGAQGPFLDVAPEGTWQSGDWLTFSVLGGANRYAIGTPLAIAPVEIQFSLWGTSDATVAGHAQTLANTFHGHKLTLASDTWLSGLLLGEPTLRQQFARLPNGSNVFQAVVRMRFTAQRAIG